MRYPGRIIKIGETDAAVITAVAAKLNARGHDISPVPATYTRAMASVVKVFQAQNWDSLGRPLRVDGQIGPLTWNALFGAPATVAPPAAGGIAVRALNFAIGEIGVEEVPPGSNRGPRVDQYLIAAGLRPPPGYFWCMAFVYFCYREAAAAAGVSNPFPQTAGCLAAWNKVKASNPTKLLTRADAVANPARVKPGMVFIHDYGGGRGHTGIVESVSGAALITIEGNADPQGGRNGLAVLRVNKRSIMDRSLKGFIGF